jgi:hypothetical protein
LAEKSSVGPTSFAPSLPRAALSLHVQHTAEECTITLEVSAGISTDDRRTQLVRRDGARVTMRSVIFGAVVLLVGAWKATATGMSLAEEGVNALGELDSSRAEDTSTLKRVVRLAEVGAKAPSVVSHRQSKYDVDPDIGYRMPDIKLQSSKGIELDELNAFVPSWRYQTQYAPGERAYTDAYEATVLEIPNAYAYTFGDDFVVLDEENVYNVGGCGEKMEGWSLSVDDTDGSEIWDVPKQTISGRHRIKMLAVLVHRFSSSYFHWMTEAMPRLMLYLDILGDEDQAMVKYLVPKNSYVRESLRLFGIQEFRQAVFYDPSSVYVAEKVIVAAGTPCGRAPKTVLNEVKDRLYKILFPRPPKAVKNPGVVILLKRNLSRQISNFDEVVEVIRGGLKTSQQLVLFDDSKKHSVISQYMMFKNADMVIGVHGGGLVNIMWSAKTTRVVEILPVTDSASGRRTRVCYASIAGSLGLDYTMIPVESVNFDSPVEVPVEDLSKVLSMS